MIELHRAVGTWADRVSHFLAVSGRVRDVLVRSGISDAKITVRKHCLEKDPGVGEHAGGYALIASRLSAEKGIAEAVIAWLRADIRGDLVIVGDGPDRERVTGLAQGHPRVRVLGHVARPELMRLMAGARILLLPSLWEEPAAPPLAGVEAIATGLPIVATAAGDLGEWVRSARVGWTAPPGDIPAWADLLKEVEANEGELRSRGRTAREEFLRSHSPSRCIEVLTETYNKVCATAGAAAHSGR
jgi:glycosyltransferase involved in cell wall biosynthesis